MGPIGPIVMINPDAMCIAVGFYGSSVITVEFVKMLLEVFEIFLNEIP